MANRTPLVLNAGQIEQLQSGDALSVAGAIDSLTLDDLALGDAVAFYDLSGGAADKTTVERLGGFLSPATNEFRLTLTSGNACPTTAVTAAGTLYWTPLANDGTITTATGRVGLYDGTRQVLRVLPEIGLSLTLTSGRNYDAFAFTSTATPSSTDTGTDTLTFGSATGWATGSAVTADATGGGLTAGTTYWYRSATATTGTLHATLAGALANTGKVDLTASVTAALTAVSLELSAAWNADNVTRTDALAAQDGIPVKSGAATRRWLGTIRASGTNTCEDSDTKWFVWNAYNQAWRSRSKVASGDSHSYTSATTRSYNNDTQYRFEYVCGAAGKNAIPLQLRCFMLSGGAGSDLSVAYGEDSTTVMNYAVTSHRITTYLRRNAVNFPQMRLGYHYLQVVESGSAGSNDFQQLSMEAMAAY